MEESLVDSVLESEISIGFSVPRLPRSEINLFPPLGIAERMRFPLLLRLLLQGELVAMELRAEEGFDE